MLSNSSIASLTNSDEWRLRRELTDFYHVVAYLGWTELIFNHISARVPGPAHHYLVNPFGLNYREITPETIRPTRRALRCTAPSMRAAPTSHASPILTPRRYRRSR